MLRLTNCCLTAEMRVLITGAHGQLGRDLTAHCSASGDEVVEASRSMLDISNLEAVNAMVREVAPDVVVNCAAWTAVDACEGDPARAELVNGTAPGWLATAARATGAHFVQISTDYVFDGESSRAYTETDLPNPKSEYGRSKLIGEQQAGRDSTIVRTSWVYSRHGGNMVATICRLMREQKTLRFVDDQVGRPTSTVDLAVAVRHLAVGKWAGLYHCANHGAVSWHDFAQAVMEAAGEDPSRVEPIKTSDMVPPRAAPRPMNSVFDCSKLESMIGTLPDFREGLSGIVIAYLD